ncbi:hypothetical protein LTR36_000779, partial [Oleoguttula mirabilis]
MNQLRDNEVREPAKESSPGPPETVTSASTTSTTDSKSESSSNPTGKHCGNCNKLEEDPERAPLKECNKCHSILYCSRDCQKADFKKHKKDCALLAQAHAQTSGPSRMQVTRAPPKKGGEAQGLHATKTLFILYDVFGFSSQILEGADKLAEHFPVFMPGFFGEQPALLEWMPLGAPEDMVKLDAFTAGPGETGKRVKRIEELRQAFQQMHPEIGSLTSYDAIRVASYAIGKNTPFSACAQSHPGFLGPEIAQQR